MILAAGVYKLPDLAGPLGDGIRGQVLAGSVAAALSAYFSVRFDALVRDENPQTVRDLLCLGRSARNAVLRCDRVAGARSDVGRCHRVDLVAQRLVCLWKGNYCLIISGLLELDNSREQRPSMNRSVKRWL